MAREVWQVGPDEAGTALYPFLRARIAGPTNGAVRRLITTGKVFVGPTAELRPTHVLAAGAEVTLRPEAPRPRRPAAKIGLGIVHEDAQLVVVNKPAGLMSVPYADDDDDTAMHRLWALWRQQGKGQGSKPLYVVHRLDKETSGLLVFARTKGAERALGTQFRAHDVDRTYRLAAHGVVRPVRLVSHLLRDRGDGIRGTALAPGRDQGRLAVTNVRVLEPLRGATLCEARLETGRTHQIRIQLAEAGHPLVGEMVYTRDYLRRGGRLLPATRLLLHAETLGIVHPVTNERLHFRQAPPPDFMAGLRRLALEPEAPR